MDIMNEEETLKTIKGKLKKLSKEELIDVLTDICMASPAFRLTNALSSLKYHIVYYFKIIRPASYYQSHAPDPASSTD